MKDILVIGGSTGTGKSDIAVQCALKMNGEVISADSMQIYKGMNVGTAKISQAEMQGIPHHMIDIVSPREPFSVSDYKKIAVPLVREIKSKGKLPIVCGGTGMYIDSLLYDMSYSGEYDPTLRASLMAELEEKGKEQMHQKLSECDPNAAARLHVNDTKRVVRAIEKAMTGGKAEDDFAKPLFSCKIYVITRPREILYDRIGRRVDRMMAGGLKKEVDDLLASGVSYDDQAMQAIAYKEWKLLSEGKSTEEVVALIKKNTRNYAKRQITWFKRYKDATVIDAEGKNAEIIADFIAKDFYQ